MSWDFHMEIDVGGYEPQQLTYDANYTYNVSPMFYEAMGGEGIRQLDGLAGAECLPKIRTAIAKMKADPEVYIAMNPKNGWGDYDGAVNLLETLAEWCSQSPKATMRVC